MALLPSWDCKLHVGKKHICFILHHTATAEASDTEAEVGAGLGVAVVN